MMLRVCYNKLVICYNLLFVCKSNAVSSINSINSFLAGTCCDKKVFLL